MTRKRARDGKRISERPTAAVLSAPQARQAGGYGRLVSDISGLLEQARRSAARAVNGILTATYWEIGRRIVEYEQGGKAKAEYGEALLVNLALDLTAKHGRGFSKSNLFQMRAFYPGWAIFQTLSGIFEARAKCPALSGESSTGKPQTRSAISGGMMAADRRASREAETRAVPAGRKESSQ